MSQKKLPGLGQAPYRDRPGVAIDVETGKQSETSRQASDIVALNLREVQAEVLGLIIQKDDTADGVCDRLGCSHNHAAPRLTELKALGLVAKTGDKALTRAGCMAYVHTATEVGVLAFYRWFATFKKNKGEEDAREDN